MWEWGPNMSFLSSDLTRAWEFMAPVRAVTTTWQKKKKRNPFSGWDAPALPVGPGL